MVPAASTETVSNDLERRIRRVYAVAMDDPEVRTTEHRAVFDAEIAFSNGGGLSARRFRVDVPRADVSSDEIARLFVTSLDLLMTDTAVVTDVTIIEEPHKGTRGGPSDPRRPRDEQGERAGIEHLRWTDEAPEVREVLVRIDALVSDRQDGWSDEALRDRIRSALAP